MVKMNIPLERLTKEIFTDEQIKQIHEKALKRSALRHQLPDAISKSVAAYMARNDINLPEIKNGLNLIKLNIQIFHLTRIILNCRIIELEASIFEVTL